MGIIGSREAGHFRSGFFPCRDPRGTFQRSPVVSCRRDSLSCSPERSLLRPPWTLSRDRVRRLQANPRNRRCFTRSSRASGPIGGSAGGPQNRLDQMSAKSVPFGDFGRAAARFLRGLRLRPASGIFGRSPLNASLRALTPALLRRLSSRQRMETKIFLSTTPRTRPLPFLDFLFSFDFPWKQVAASFPSNRYLSFATTSVFRGSSGSRLKEFSCQKDHYRLAR